MTSRERVIKSLNHEQPDKVPFDMGSTAVTGIAAYALYRLRERLGLPTDAIKVHEPFQILGMVEEDLMDKIGIDVVGLFLPRTMFGYKNKNWKPWRLPNGTNVLVGEKFELAQDESGDYLIFPQGNRSAKPSGKLPKNGFFFDNIVRQKELDEDHLDGKKDFEKDYQLFDEETLRSIENEAENLFRNTDLAINASFSQAALGDFAPLPGPGQLDPDGIRSPEEWMIAHYTHPDYIKDIYEYQIDTAIENLKLYKQAVGDKIQIIQISGTDFGSQRGELMSRDMFCEFYKPYYKRINDWVHQHTQWKVFYHSCGSILNLLDDFVEIGVDVLNPVQISAKGMDPQWLKDHYGKKFTFWGGATNTQKTLPFGTAEQVKAESLELLKIFSKDGGFIYNAVHNIQSNVPTENIIAFIEALQEFNMRRSI